jgi:hypothetical protein
MDRVKEKKERKKPDFKEEVVSTLPTKDGGEIRFSVLEAEGRQFADIRKYEEWGEPKKLQPRKVGFTFSSSQEFRKFRDAAEKLAEKLA